ncbi:MAG: adenylate/guanylate cyclase domain-containing protein [Rhodospirillales bacterium]
MLDTQVLQRICDEIAAEIDVTASIYSPNSMVIASSREDWIGDFNAGAKAVLSGSVPFHEVRTGFEGVIFPVEHRDQRILCVGIIAPMRIAHAAVRIVQHWIQSLLQQSELAESETRFRDIAESASDWIWEMDAGLRFTYLSDRFFEIFKIPREHIIGKSRAEFASSNSNDSGMREHNATLAARLPFRDYSYKYEGILGRPFWIKISGKPLHSESGEFLGYRGTGTNITGETEAKRALDSTRQLLSDAIETLSEAFSLYDQNERLVLFNKKYSDLFYNISPGMSFEAVIRSAAENGMIPDAIGRVEQWVKERLVRRQTQEQVYIQQVNDDEWMLISEHRTSDGGTVTLYSDISELKQREKELAEKTNSLEQLSSQLAKYLSPQVYESIFTGRQEVKVTSQRKKLTIFMSDIVGFTETSERLAPEDLTQLLNDYLTEMAKIALQYGATIDKYVGDGIVIFFGDPESRGVKEDAVACVEMAIAMRNRMIELEEDWHARGLETPLKSRFGVNTGFCTVGNFGSEDRLDYTIVGSGANLASRLESMSEPGQILISYETFALVKDRISCVEYGKIDVKGFPRPVAIYSVEDTWEQLGKPLARISEDRPNFKLSMDLPSMTTEERSEAAVALRKALANIEEIC